MNDIDISKRIREIRFSIASPDMIRAMGTTQITIPEFSERLDQARQIMVNASVNVVGGPIRVDAEKITSNFKQADKDQQTFDEIMKEIKNYRTETIN